MKFINKLSKKTKIISLLILLITVSSTTLALLNTYSNPLINTFNIREQIDTEIKETIVGTNLMKAPYIENIDKKDVIVKVRIVISGNFDDFALAGIDTGYKCASSFQSASYNDGEYSSKYWETLENNQSDGKQEYVFLYKKVLYGTLQEEKPHITEPVFDQILLKDDENYIQYGTGIDSNQKEKFNKLENIKISIYQESLPVKVVVDDDITLNADDDNDGNIDIEQAKEIFNYFAKEVNSADD